MVVGLGDRLGRPVLVDVADFEVLEVTAVRARPGGLALALVGLKLVSGGLALEVLWSLMEVRARGGALRKLTRESTRVES